MKGTHKFVIGSLVLPSFTLPLDAAGGKIDFEGINAPAPATGRGSAQ